MSSAIVFAYHNVGVRCLKVLLAAGVDIRLVVTHKADPNENIWFQSVEQVCIDYDLPYLISEDVSLQVLKDKAAACTPDFLFSFYYRNMLDADFLAIPAQGAYNMHGSLLPAFRGRAPVNWAVLKGATETGASLHAMEVKPDKGAVVAQVPVPILPDDTASEVFDKVAVAAELCLHGALPALLAGLAPHIEQDHAKASYYGRRTPADGAIQWADNAQTIHNMVRALTHPYPGAFTDTNQGKLFVWRTRVLPHNLDITPCVLQVDAQHRMVCRPAGGGTLLVLNAQLNGETLDAAALMARFQGSLPLPH